MNVLLIRDKVAQLDEKLKSSDKQLSEALRECQLAVQDLETIMQR